MLWAFLLFYSCVPMILGNDSGVAIAPGVEPIVLSIQLNCAVLFFFFCRPACEPFVCLMMLASLLETHEAQLADRCVCLHGALRPGLPSSIG